MVFLLIIVTGKLCFFRMCTFDFEVTLGVEKAPPLTKPNGPF